jgi:hypothetical protein
MLKKVILGVLLVIILAAAGFTVWAMNAAGPMPDAQAALRSSDTVQVTAAEWLVFRPDGPVPATGFILYPGGRVDYRAYAPYAHQVAQQGYLVVVVSAPLNLAVLSPDSAGGVMEAFPEVSNWIVGGHSLGGAMAARYAARHSEQVHGLVLLAAYPSDSDSLAEAEIKVLSLYASNDGLATVDKIASTRTLLPASTNFVEIAGGNHAQFGWYGEQSGDGPADITREEQHAIIVAKTVDFLSSFQSQ